MWVPVLVGDQWVTIMRDVGGVRVDERWVYVWGKTHCGKDRPRSTNMRVEMGRKKWQQELGGYGANQ